jgi:hypothetical protein
MIKKLLIFFTIICLFIGIHSVKASVDSFSIGTLEEKETKFINDLEYNKYHIKDGSISHRVYNIEIGRYSDFDIVLHDKLYGDNAVGLATVMDIALDYEAKTGKVVYAAINGDYFSGGLPVDFYAVNNNILRIGPYSHTLGKNSFGFSKTQHAVIGKVEYGYKININDQEKNYIDYVHIDRINQTLQEGEIGVYTYNMFQKITGSNIAKLSVRFDKIIGNYALPFAGTVYSDVNDFVFNDLDYPINYRDFAIAAKGNSTGYTTLHEFINNDSFLTVYPYPINDWEGMDFIIGGWQVLLNNRNKLPDPIHDGGYSLAPRTSIGIKGDGTIGLTVVDGRLANIPGLNLEQLADLNEDLGYFTALELDGGGSSTFLLRNLETNVLEVVNTPSDGSLRRFANAILIVGDPIQSEITTTEEITTTTTQQTTTEEVTSTTEASTNSTATSTTSTTITTTNTTSIQSTTITSFETSSQENTTSTDTSNNYDRSDCSSCNKLNTSIIIICIFLFSGYMIIRYKFN